MQVRKMQIQKMRIRACKYFFVEITVKLLSLCQKNIKTAEQNVHFCALL